MVPPGCSRGAKMVSRGAKMEAPRHPNGNCEDLEGRRRVARKIFLVNLAIGQPPFNFSKKSSKQRISCFPKFFNVATVPQTLPFCAQLSQIILWSFAFICSSRHHQSFKKQAARSWRSLENPQQISKTLPASATGSVNPKYHPDDWSSWTRWFISLNQMSHFVEPDYFFNHRTLES